MDDKVMQLVAKVNDLMEVQKQKERLLMRVLDMCLTQLKKPDGRKKELIAALTTMLATHPLTGDDNVAAENGERTH